MYTYTRVMQTLDRNLKRLCNFGRGRINVFLVYHLSNLKEYSVDGLVTF